MKQVKEYATFASGCFWCTEAVFQRVKGVQDTVSGYTGGKKENPSYDQVSGENTGHAEAIQFTYDPDVISYQDLLKIFFSTHDPTTSNRQGDDIGTQYRSAIFYHDEMQKTEAEKVISRLEKEKTFDKPIVTEIIPYTKFYKAERYHQDYYNNNKNQPYCQVVINPKLAKLRKEFADKLRDKSL
jgi:peptide-methionine (S)-S-oxide reductase